MVMIQWGVVGTRQYENGVDQGVYYAPDGIGYAWSGLVSVNENLTGGELESFYFEGIKFIDIVGGEDFQATVEALSTPPQFAAADGFRSIATGLFVDQQPRTTFGMSYRTRIGTDDNPDKGYKLHIVYNATALPSARVNKTLSATPEPMSKQWTIETVPAIVPGALYKPTAHLIIDSTLAAPAKLLALEKILYGAEAPTAILPTQADVAALFLAA